jgi:hypothetical protein
MNIINPPILFGIIFVNARGLVDKVMNLVTEKNSWSALMSSSNKVEIYSCTYFGSDHVQVCQECSLIAIKQRSGSAEVIMTVMKLVGHRSKMRFDIVTFCILITRKTKWTMAMVFGQTTTNNSFVGTIKPFLPMTLILTIISVGCIPVVRPCNDITSDLINF